MEAYDEVEESTKKFFFGDKVQTPTGETGTVTELDGVEYRVANSEDLGWFLATELKKYHE